MNSGNGAGKGLETGVARIASAVFARMLEAEAMLAWVLDGYFAGHRPMTAREAAKWGHEEGWCDGGGYDCPICSDASRIRGFLASATDDGHSRRLQENGPA